MKKFLATAAIALIATVTGSADSYAECRQKLKLYQSATRGTGDDNYAFYYGTSETVGFPAVTFYTIVYESDESLNILMENAFANRLTVIAAGNAASCPTSSNYRYMGVLQSAIVYQLR